ncbi:MULTISPECIES: entericidin A/B family lipoprotein [Burkholderiaceae]|nr:MULTISPECIES: entericidin A/B family lipoprotein [Burkholderiaceae]MCF2134378.1 entericidin A/B family lipoprotein [Mycetohabitans sp. B3]MCG1019032.1 entericidin A/B family lipoprotein [Mycetohabitans sp. B4]MCG1039830.1 entericidin A/B family lipoprotein [Mycetohabitans sp. B7]SIT71145.1 Predicted small secreted protein [Burkholderia sp. b14]SIT73695.1 Predicted small secreted protein [Burkholderia sp. b13]
MKRVFIGWFAVAAAVLGCAAIAGCNTVSGFGQDMREAGAAIKKAAE